ncbi:MAG: hypothetical protein K6T83_10320 [Alicyclobacillus sp.]|nr:hypothetical protein [Alicyclobacillus sp.]
MALQKAKREYQNALDHVQQILADLTSGATVDESTAHEAVGQLPAFQNAARKYIDTLKKAIDLTSQGDSSTGSSSSDNSSSDN